jgi:Methyltransferase domain
VLELGVRGGNSTVALLAGLEERGGTLWSVDIDPACAEVFAGHPQWRFVLADSRDESAVVGAGLPAEVDVLFIDTIHTFEQVRDELDLWGDRVRQGGVIFFHDTDPFPDIRRAISAWCRQRRIPYEFVGRSNGLGVAYPGGGSSLRALLALRRGLRLAGRDLRGGLRLARRAARRARNIVLSLR